MALGREAIVAGCTVLFTGAMDLVANLAKARTDGRLEERLTHYAKPKLLIVDELGDLLGIPPGAAHLFFQLVSRRYERGAMLVTSNRAVGKWGFTQCASVIAPIEKMKPISTSRSAPRRVGCGSTMPPSSRSLVAPAASQ